MHKNAAARKKSQLTKVKRCFLRITI
ncbi:MAG: hypothetical protein ACLS48_10085 [[Eubacterium] siraeum]